MTSDYTIKYCTCSLKYRYEVVKEEKHYGRKYKDARALTDLLIGTSEEKNYVFHCDEIEGEVMSELERRVGKISNRSLDIIGNGFNWFVKKNGISPARIRTGVTSAKGSCP